MSDPIETPLGDWIASFDGRVLEVFTPYQEGSMRYFVRLLEGCAIDGNVLTVSFRRRDQGFWPFQESQREGVQRLVQAIIAARA
jgi:hypothetical protein